MCMLYIRMYVCIRDYACMCICRYLYRYQYLYFYMVSLYVHMHVVSSIGSNWINSQFTTSVHCILSCTLYHLTLDQSFMNCFTQTQCHYKYSMQQKSIYGTIFKCCYTCIILIITLLLSLLDV